jgi:hypothetical protein
MSLFDSLKNLFGGAADESYPSSRLHVIDGSRLAANGSRDRSPRDQLALLQQLAGFAQKEKIKACVILPGRPLREAAEGADFKGIRVYYADSAEQMADRALRQAKKSSGSLLITQDRDIEKQAQSAGIETMRVTTFRKAMESGGGGDNGAERSRDGGRNRRRSRGGRRSGGAPRQQPDASQPQEKQSAPVQKKDSGGVSDLIDLV